MDNKTLTQKPIDFTRIGYLNTMINRLLDTIQAHINSAESRKWSGGNSSKGMILYGPPGNGKMMIARAVAHSMGASFIEVDRSELLSKYVGDPEKNLEYTFKEAAAKGNCVIFIDEIDSLASARTGESAEHQVSLVATLLVLMDGINSNHRVFVIGATNRLDSIDPALRRPGRFDLEFEVPFPDQHGLLDVLRGHVSKDNFELPESDIGEQGVTEAVNTKIDFFQEGEDTYFKLFAGCPVCYDQGRNAPRTFWKHYDNNCHGAIYIGDNAFYKCKKCGHSSHVKNWEYDCGCPTHSNYLDAFVKEGSSTMAGAVSLAGQMVIECGLPWLQKFLANMGEWGGEKGDID